MRVLRLQWRSRPASCRHPRRSMRTWRQAKRWCRRRRLDGRQGPHAPGRTVRQPRPGTALKRRQPCRIQTRHRAVGRTERRHLHHLAGHEQAAGERKLRSGAARRWLDKRRILARRRHVWREWRPGGDRLRDLRRRQGSLVPGRARTRTASAYNELPGSHLPGLSRRRGGGHSQGLRCDRQRIGLEGSYRHVARRLAHHKRIWLCQAAKRRDCQCLRPAPSADQGNSRLRRPGRSGCVAARRAVCRRADRFAVCDAHVEHDLDTRRNPLEQRFGAAVRPRRRQTAGRAARRLLACRRRRQRRRQPPPRACAAAWRRLVWHLHDLLLARRPEHRKAVRRDRFAERQTATGLRRLGGLRRDVRERHGAVQPAGCAGDLLEQPQRLTRRGRPAGQSDEKRRRDRQQRLDRRRPTPPSASSCRASRRSSTSPTAKASSCSDSENHQSRAHSARRARCPPRLPTPAQPQRWAEASNRA